jgi:predicted TIM-barrel fold metal-dependent hydrolase
MQSIGHEVLMQYRLNEAVGRPFDSTVNVARMIASGVFDRHPKLQVLIVHMGGGLASIVGRLEFNWHLNCNGIKNPPAGKPYTNKRSPFDYCKTNILLDTMGFNAIGVRAAIELCGVDRVVFGTDFGPVPYGMPIRSRSGDRRLEASLARPLFTDPGGGLERDPTYYL